MKKYIIIAFLIIAISLISVFIFIKDSSSVKENSSYKISVVSAENQYGSIAKLIGGDRVTVTNIIDNANGDPHTFVSSIQNAKILATADVIIYNGADYDSWIVPILKSNKNATIVKVQDLINIPQSSKFGINPHLWYNPNTFSSLANKLADIFAQKDPKNNTLFKKNLENFNYKYQKVYDLIKKINQKYAGTPVTATEPLFGYMANALGLDMKGLDFQWVIMNNSEPSPKMMIKYQSLFKDKKIKALFYNKQVTDNVTRNILELANKNKIPVVGITETMPINDNAINWMIQTLQATSQALDKAKDKK